MKTHIAHRWRLASLSTLIILVSISIQSFLPRSIAHADTIAQISLSNTHQTIDGFGGSGAQLGAYDLQSLPDATRTQILDLLFSQTNGAGLSIVRSEICGGADYNTDNFECKSIEPQQGTWNWSSDGEEIWLMNQAKNRGVSTFMSTSWSPPAWMKTNNSTVGGTLSSDKYQAYADYLTQYVLNYKSRFGIDMYALSPQNEPDSNSTWPSSLMDGNQLKDFIHNYLKPDFQQNNITTKIIMPEVGNWSNVPSYANPILTDSNTSNDVDIMAGHSYDGHYDPLANTQGKPIWESEVSSGDPNDSGMGSGLSWAMKVHNFMVTTQASAWLYWEFISQRCCADQQYSLISVDFNNNTYIANKRLFTLGNYSRFVRPGYQRIDVTENPTSGVYLSAYKDPASSKVVVVAINQNGGDQALSLQTSDFQSSSLTPYVTSSTQNLAQQTPVTATGNTFAVTLPAQSVTTFVGDVSVGGTSNLVQDPGFENQTNSTLSSPWSRLEGSGSVGVDYHLAGYPHGGNNDGWISSASGWTSIGQSISVTPNTNYTLSCWERDSNNITGYLGVYYTSSKTAGPKTETSFSGSSTYTLRSETFNSGSNNSVTMYIGYPGVANSYLVADDCSVTAS
ncbi:glycoside hydrolase family 30 protein [Tengunoibacter tsumagoiensis]|uniref:Xylan degradation protein n=1 Tax=Tengunoibacter tsumagoiensis TaxID=2014871 RepID=A0A402A6G0_9CHLR|nr:glycoside hydrolase [Tengunoibacter tsumagoiensis]GCE14605.1 xylan degradation protein [Tengunoibacter tsumagoiensis]